MSTNQKLMNSLATLTFILEDDHKDYLDLFLPFIKEIFEVAKVTEVDGYHVVKLLKDIHGLPIPYHAVCSILTRCKKRKMLVSKNKKYYVASDLSHINALCNYSKDTSGLIKVFRSFYQEREGKEIPVDDTYELFLGFLDDYSYQILLSYRKRVSFSDIKLRMKEKRLVGDFIDSLIEEESELLEELLDLTVSSLVVNLLAYDRIEGFVGKLKRVKVFIDTPLILKFLGVEGAEKQEAFEEFFNIVKQHGGEICIFKHTFEETMHILTDCKKYIDDPSTKPNYASEALKYFMSNQYSSVQLTLFVSKVTTKLDQYHIKYDVEVNPDRYRPYQIDEDALATKISTAFGHRDYAFENYRNRQVVLNDVKSLSNIYRLRQGDTPITLPGSKSIFVTTNSALTFASFDFEDDFFENYHIHACFTDVFLGTLLWLQSPTEIERINKLNLIAKCKEYLRPEDKLVDVFLEKIESFHNESTITDKEYYFLRTHKIPMEIINRKTYGDHELFEDKLAEEILEDIKESARSEERVIFQPIVDENKELISSLTETTEDFVELKGNVSSFINAVSCVISWILFGVGCGLTVLSIYASTLPAENQWKARLAFQILGGVIALANILFGFNVIGLRRRIQSYLREKLDGRLINKP